MYELNIPKINAKLGDNNLSSHRLVRFHHHFLLGQYESIQHK